MVLRKCYSGRELIPLVYDTKTFLRKQDRIKKEKYINNRVNVSNDEYHEH